MAVLRLALPWANLPATTALASLRPEDGQRQALPRAATCSCLPFTPAARRAAYRIYDHKAVVDMDAVRRAIAGAGLEHALPEAWAGEEGRF